MTAVAEFVGDGLGDEFLACVKQYALPGFRIRTSTYTFRSLLEAEIVIEQEECCKKSLIIWDYKNQLAQIPSNQEFSQDIAFSCKRLFSLNHLFYNINQ